MANVTPSIAPGSFADPFSMTLGLSSAVDYVNYTVNGAAPAISKYIAYDTLSPPNPFIAVTQDGAGNVVYDGGFPKFYNNNAPTEGIDSSASMEFKATCTGVATGVNAYYYNAFSEKQVAIAAGDKLIYDMWMNSADARCSIDAVTANSDTTPYYSLRDWGGGTTKGVYDQNGYASHPQTSLGTLAVNKWYHREFDLSKCAGYTFIRWSMAYEGETAGDFYTRFRNVYIIDANGKIKATLFKDTIDLPNNSSAEVGASGYTNLSKALYDPRSQLAASFKYLYNALYWCTSEANLLAGNKKVLVLGDATTGMPYWIKGTGDDGFYNSITRLCAAAGFTATFKDPTDYPAGVLNESLASLNGYACVLLMSTYYNDKPWISDACVQDLQTFRAGGGGIIVITDHGVDVGSIGEAYVSSTGKGATGFFCTANKLIVNFGTYFTGNFDRTPVNVGFLRTNYGDHPLYGGMTSDESIQAGGSESKVVVASFTKYTVANLPAFAIPTGRTTLQVLAVLKDGTLETYKLVYSVASGELLGVFDSGGNALSKLDLGWGNTATLSAVINGAGLGTLAGDILLGSTKIASLAFTEAGGSKLTWVGSYGTRLRLNNGDVVKVRITSPFTYERSFTVTRTQPDLTTGSAEAHILPKLKSMGAQGTTPAALLASAMSKINTAMGAGTIKFSSVFATNLAALRDYFKK